MDGINEQKPTEYSARILRTPAVLTLRAQDHLALKWFLILFLISTKECLSRPGDSSTFYSARSMFDSLCSLSHGHGSGPEGPLEVGIYDSRGQEQLRRSPFL